MNLINKDSSSHLLLAVKDMISNYRYETAMVFMALLFASFFEGITLISLFPLLSIVLGEASTESDPIFEAFQDVFELLGLSMDFGSVLLVIVAGSILKAIFHVIAMSYVGFVSARIAYGFRTRLIRALLAATWGYFVDQPIGRFSNALSNETSSSATLYLDLCRLSSTAIQSIVFLGLALTLSLTMSLVAILAGCIMLMLLHYFVRIARRAGKVQAKTYANLMRSISDGLQGIKVLKAMHLEDRIGSVLEHEIKILESMQRKQVFAKYALADAREPFIVIFAAIGIFLAIDRWDVPLPELFTMVILFQRSVNALGNLQGTYQNVVACEPFYWSLSKTVNEASTMRENLPNGKNPDFRRTIRLENISFSYGDNLVLDNVDLEIPRGKLTALVGPSGSGKTTIGDIICALQLPDAGRVLIDDLDLRDADIQSWRRRIGYIPQETFLFHETISVNVAFGENSISDEGIEAALEKAGAIDFVKNSEDGIETVVGERGVKFSGGQRQRIAIARTLVRDAEFLLLDEATASLDPETEMELVSTLKNLLGEVTILAISHRPAIVDAADKIYRIANGRIQVDFSPD